MALDWAALTKPCNTAFGEAATFEPAAGASFAINGVFDEAYREVTFGEGGQAVTSEMPVIGVQLQDFAAAPLQGDHVVVTRTGERFVVKEVRPDSHGWAILLLNYTG